MARVGEDTAKPSATEPSVGDLGTDGMDLIASAEAYRNVAALFNEPIFTAKNAVTIIDNGMKTTGTPWSEKGMSAEFGQKFPPAMEKLMQALIDTADGLASLRRNFLVMAQNIDDTETINRG